MSEQGQGAGAQFVLQRIYIRDSSFESPRAPQSFLGQWKPKINLELNSRSTRIDEDVHEVVLVVTVTARSDEDEVLYLAEVQQAGVFLVKGFSGDTLEQTLGSFCPGVLFPYAREALDAMVVKGSFPPLMLAPVNFDAIYEQTRQQRAANSPQTH
jgi:preprotein translocase subunit SecB